MTIGEICRRQVEFIGPATSVRTAAQRMATHNVGMLLVVDGCKRTLGLVTDRDLALRVVGAGCDPNLTCVSDVMTPHPETIGEDASVEDALAVMRLRSVRRLPVVGPNDGLVGVVSLDDVLVLLAHEFGSLSGLVEHSSPRMLAYCQPWSDSP